MNALFARELRRWGPESRHETVSLARAQAFCRQLARSHYENFSVASLLLPRRLRKHFHAVYAYCRWADDLADETGGGTRAAEMLRWWREELMACYAGSATHPVMVALRETIVRFDIPAAPFLNLLVAFEQDQTIHRYQTYEELLGYCRCSANPVGHLVLYLCECHDRENATLADCICTGLQLANFWQDVARDFDIGRVYLPAEDRQRIGYTDEMLAERRFNPEFAALLRLEVGRTRELFRQGAPLVGRLPPDVRLDIELFLQGGLAILRKIEHCDYNVWHSRPSLAKWEKAALIAGALWKQCRERLCRS